jgi:hypothetical protein
MHETLEYERGIKHHRWEWGVVIIPMKEVCVCVCEPALRFIPNKMRREEQKKKKNKEEEEEEEKKKKKKKKKKKAL